MKELLGKAGFALLSCCTLALTAHAEGESSQSYVLDIEALPLMAAVKTLADETGIEVLFFSDIAEGVTSSPVQGRYTANEALNAMLVSTDLEVVTLDKDGAVAIRSMEEAPNAGKSQPASNPMLIAQNQASDPEEQMRTGRRNRAEDEGDEERRLRMEEILVTGSRIRGALSASPLNIITDQEIEQAGFATVEQLVGKLPQNFGGGASLDTFTDSIDNVDNVVGGRVDNRVGGTSVNLRGLGASSTLILLNGRRMTPSGHTARFTNIASIPVSAIERVEVLTDGASAIYGSDAIGGVVNFILRKDYQGAETRLRFSSDDSGDTSNVLFGQTYGTSWADGNLLLTYEYYDSDRLANSEREFTASNDLSRFGGTDRRAPGGNPANIVAGGQTFAIPAGQDGTALTPADFDPNAPANLNNARARGDAIPAQQRHSAFAHLRQSFGPVEVFAEARFSNWTRENRRIPLTVDLTVPDSNPWFVDPTGTGLTTVTVDNYSLADDLAPRLRFGEVDTYGTVLGMQFNIAESWNAELYGNWTKEDAVASGQGFTLNQNALDDALSQTDPSLAFNPFGDGSNTNPAILEAIMDYGRRITDESTNELWAVNLNIDGTVMDLPGGNLQVAAGIDFREESLQSLANASGLGRDVDRDIVAVYTEFFFPLVGGANSRPGLQRLELSLAGRYEDYSDFGGSTNPKVGLVWSPTESLMLRGTYGTSFRAPALVDLDAMLPIANRASYLPQLVADAGLIPFPLIVRGGGNEDLEAEEATTWTAGFEWSPERISGLMLGVTYFNIDFNDRIDVPTNDVLDAANNPRFGSLLILDPTLEELVALVDDPRWQEERFGFFTSAEDLLSGAAPVGGILDMRVTNLSRSVVTGMQMQLSYDFETALGSFGIGLNGDYLFDFERAFIEGDPLVDEVSTLGRPIDLRVRGNVSWSREAFSVSGFLNYMDDYTDTISDPERPVSSWTTVDLTVSYDTQEGGVDGLLSNVRLSLSAQNLFDEDPPFVDTIGGVAYDSANANPMGRMLALQIAKE